MAPPPRDPARPRGDGDAGDEGARRAVPPRAPRGGGRGAPARAAPDPDADHHRGRPLDGRGLGDLLRHLHDVAPRHAVAGLRHPPGRGQGLSRARSRPGRITMRPAPLDEADCIALLEFLTRGPSRSRLTSSLALARRSGGNPLLVRELLSATQAAGSIDGLPDSVESLMTSRIDRLAPSDRVLLAARGGARRVVLAAAPRASSSTMTTPPPADDDWHRLAEFVELRSDGTVAFRRSLVRDAAYEGLPFRLRRELHARAGSRSSAACPTPRRRPSCCRCISSMPVASSRRGGSRSWPVTGLGPSSLRSRPRSSISARWTRREAFRTCRRRISPTCTRRSATSATGPAPSRRRATPIALPAASSPATPCERPSSC